MTGYPVLTPTTPSWDASGIPTVTNGPVRAASSYRTVTARDVDAFAGVASIGSAIDLSIPAAEWYMGQTYPSTNGVLVGFSCGVPYLLGVGQDGQAVLSDGGLPYVDSSITPEFSGDSAGPDGTRLWLERTFGKR